ncbi:MAG: galactonate dehydratase [Planctomycetaceae bacterium]|nr:galactonate dehydratase [Planctomycetaceae bacterium]
MKITRINTHILGDVRNFFFVQIHTDEGITGIGEGGITWRERAMAGFVEDMKAVLLGQDPFQTEHLWQVMLRSGFFPGGRIGAAAMSAIDIALWDIKAKALGVPLYQLFGGKVRDKVACYPHIVGNSPEELADAAQEKKEAGWKFARWDILENRQTMVFEPSIAIPRCVADFAAIRDRVGDQFELIIDGHTRLDPVDAIPFCRQLEPYRPFFVEDPIRMENFDSFRKLSRHVDVPLAAGEQYATKWEFRQQVEEDLIDYARIDVCNVGGFTESMKIAGWCETHYIKVAFHNPLGPVSTAACMHLDFATSNFAVQEIAREPGTVLPDVFPVQAPFESGHLQLPTAPGLGIEFDEAAAAKYPAITDGGCPIFTRADGTFTNW